MTEQAQMETAPAWNDRRFVFFRGQFDTNIQTGEDYQTQALRKIFGMPPGNKPKGAGLACIPSTYCDYDARDHAVQRERGSYIALTGDVDSGNHSLDAIKAAVLDFAQGAAWLIYSSPHARPGDMRWRIILPLADEQPFDAWHDAQIAFYSFMEARGIAMDHALARAAQPVYLPNVPDSHGKSGTTLRGEDGKPLYYTADHSSTDAPGLELDAGPIAERLAAIRHQRAIDEQERERIRREAERKRANRPRGETASLIEDFNAENSVATILEICGYQQSPRSADDWRSPYQTGETFATRVIGSKWVSLSASDTAAGIGEKCAAGCYGDAYDLFVHYKHGGDHKAAFRALHAERRAASGNVIYPAQFEPPAWLDEIAPHDEAPEYYFDGEPDLEPIIEPEAPAKTLAIVDAFDFDEAALPPRPWLIPGVILSGYTHMLAAPGGSGKSLFTLQLAIALAKGEAWGGFVPRRAARSLIINVEDDIIEQRRRLAAARRVMGDCSGIRGMVLLAEEAADIVVAKAGPNEKTIVATPIVDELRRYIIDNAVDTIIVDPFAETFEGDENDNSQVKWAMRIWRDEIARATGCAVYLVHHTTKHAQNGAGDANVIRGAGAIVNSTRISATLMPMSEQDAATIGIEPEERHLYVRYDDAKANQSLKSNSARWFRKQSLTLDNATPDHPADEVGALVPWSPPDTFEGLSSHMVTTILETIHRGRDDGTRYKLSTKGGTVASGKWVGCIVMRLADIGEAQARRVVDTWERNGVLVEMPYPCPVRRRQENGVFAPLENRPGN